MLLSSRALSMYYYPALSLVPHGSSLVTCARSAVGCATRRVRGKCGVHAGRNRKLEGHFEKLLLVNPKYIKGLNGYKTDPKRGAVGRPGERFVSCAIGRDKGSFTEKQRWQLDKESRQVEWLEVQVDHSGLGGCG